MCEVPKNCADCECECERPQVWGEIDVRREALKFAIKNGVRMYHNSAEIVAAAADFYNFLNGDLITSNIDKLDAIADILADD
jgi:2-keto-4-pentenoate hydratase/2-oxohepta-3-ene-1,7-dioic acid hydratase in catechol pathway